jgi:hypothetical protein
MDAPSVRPSDPSVRPTVRLSVRPFVRPCDQSDPSVRPIRPSDPSDPYVQPWAWVLGPWGPQDL